RLLPIDPTWNGRSQEPPTRRGEKLPAVNRFTNARAAHAEPPELPFDAGQIVTAALYASGRGSHKIVLAGRLVGSRLARSATNLDGIWIRFRASWSSARPEVEWKPRWSSHVPGASFDFELH